MEKWTVPGAGEIQFELMEEFGEETEIIKTEQVAIKSGLSRLEKRVDKLEKKQV